MASNAKRASYRWSRERQSDDAARRPFDVGVDVAADESALPPTMAQAIEKFGFPVSNKPPDEELIDLLVNAAEIEHGLLVQYLYASASATDPSIKAALKLIAIEEMGHFITVQNLLLAFGGAPHLDHDDWTSTAFFRPFPFRLELVFRV